MSENDKKEPGADADSASEEPKPSSGPQFTKGPDPLAGVKKAASNVNASMEGKTVSMRTYVGSIIAVIVLMMLARCGG